MEDLGTGHVMRIQECDPAKNGLCTKPGGSGDRADQK